MLNSFDRVMMYEFRQQLGISMLFALDSLEEGYNNQQVQITDLTTTVTNQSKTLIKLQEQIDQLFNTQRKYLR